ncbi:GNAT family N-acetyltransferase [Virgibacillus salexigens]|uniref:GNAT family N-acetyltransferase n=1 Tax=Virgibacillus kapii TaxID=1638645 RepID=A0ABQ2DYM6_9BACI|nr:hypothetical protein [Virgibacillus kapii]GGJ77837.1 hypothetical protein GCM10007111_44220 [Virgibacillus kapii]
MTKKQITHDNEQFLLDIKVNNCSSYLHTYSFDLFNKHYNYIVECSCEFYPTMGEFKVKTITNISGKENRGYASIVMQHVLKKANELGVDKITGFISPFDIGTKELKYQVYGFYKKHGAAIKGNEFEIVLKHNEL